MKITLLHGQDHRQSSWYTIRLLLEQLPAKILYEFYSPRGMPYFCCSCYRCTELREDFCPYTAYMAPIIKAMKETDLFILITPTCYLRTSGSIKAFLDRCFLNFVVHRPPSSMYHKRAVVLTFGTGSGMKKAVKDIHTSLTGQGVSHISSYDFRSVVATWGAIPENIKRRLTTDLAKPVGRIERKQHHKRISWKQKLLFHAVRQMQKHGMGAGELDYQYWEERDWLGRSRPWTDDEQNTYIYFWCTTCIRLLLYAV